MVKKYETVAVVVTYNRKRLLKKCIGALLEILKDNDDFAVIVVDNHSTDGSRKYIDKYLKKTNIFYRDTGSNLGGAGGFNFGIREAYKLSKKYVWVMDDDCIVTKGSLNALTDFAKSKDDEFGFLSSKVLWKDLNISRMNAQRRTMFIPLRKFNQTAEIALGTFVSMFVKKSVIRELGLPIKDFFIWSDDWEYTRRISREYKCYFVPSSIVVHESENNNGCNIVIEDGERLSRYKYAYRNEMYIYRREGILGWIYVYLRNLYNFLFIILRSKTKKIEKIKLIIESTREGKKFNPEIEFPIGDK